MFATLFSHGNHIWSCTFKMPFSNGFITIFFFPGENENKGKKAGNDTELLMVEAGGDRSLNLGIS